jgi:hypothetical protein
MTLCLRPLAVLALIAIALHSAHAAPGAHGPNGEHLDAPAFQAAAPAQPRLQAHTEAFELVATLQGGELSVLVDRYDSNEPVLGATLEVDSGGLKARATFQADRGDYTFDDEKLLALLRTPGEHALVFTLSAGKDSDLLDGTLVTTATGDTAPADHDHGHHPTLGTSWAVAGVLVLGLVGGFLWRRKRLQFNTAAPQGGLK